MGLNIHKPKGSGIIVLKDLPLADRVKRREAEKGLKIRLDAGRMDQKVVKFRVLGL